MFDDLRAEIATASAVSTESAPVTESTTESTTSTPSETNDNSTQPSETGTTSQKPAGPIPFDRHQSILENARKKAADETRAEYAWLTAHGDQQAIQQQLALAQAAQRDPAGFVRNFLQVAKIDPASLIGTQSEAPARPEPDILLDNGQYTYSDAQLQKLLAFERESLARQQQEELGPLKQAYALAQMQEQATGNAKTAITEASQWEGFQERRKEIAAVLKANPNMDLKTAYITVIGKAFKDSTTRAYEQALADLRNKATAAGAPVPRGSSPSSTAAPVSLRDALVEAWRESR